MCETQIRVHFLIRGSNLSRVKQQPNVLSEAKSMPELRQKQGKNADDAYMTVQGKRGADERRLRHGQIKSCFIFHLSRV
ncbi:hypothetical protein HCH_06168 [Hahella chejuensis KCTC 2396]|uniref:Uncharacterized protein n=1 Tax=Hahella chejuensis (strain KCTC 2396) TaxID=349521 RepID=Q2S961_HAHCH|nr:hypothetical protein HCH_06168 [Hahella chejuensis KCTC 2396]